MLTNHHKFMRTLVKKKELKVEYNMHAFYKFIKKILFLLLNQTLIFKLSTNVFTFDLIKNINI